MDLKHLVYYILAWIIYTDNYYEIHKILKSRNYKHLERIYWTLDKKKYRNAKYI